jgi:hypothetical protein
MLQLAGIKANTNVCLAALRRCCLAVLKLRASCNLHWPLLQTLLLPGMSVAAPTPSSDGCLYIASSSDKGIRQLRPVPLERQAKLLAAAGDFQGALELLTLMEDEEVTAAAAAAVGSDAGSEVAGSTAAAAAVKRQQLEDVLRLRFGYHLFEGATRISGLVRGALVVALYAFSMYVNSLLSPGDVLPNSFSTRQPQQQNFGIMLSQVCEECLVYCPLYVLKSAASSPVCLAFLPLPLPLLLLLAS